MLCAGCSFISATSAPTKEDLIEELKSIETEAFEQSTAREEALQQLASVWLCHGNGTEAAIMPTASSAHIRHEIAASGAGEAGSLVLDEAGNMVTPYEEASRSVHRRQAGGLLGEAAGPGVQAATAASQLVTQREILPRQLLSTALFSKCRRCVGAARSGLLHKPSLQPLHGDSSSVLAGHARHQKHVSIASILPLVQFTDACAVQRQPCELSPDAPRGLGIAPDGRLCAGRLHFDVPGGPSWAALRHTLPSISPLVGQCVAQTAAGTDDVCCIFVDIVLRNALRQPVCVTVGGSSVEGMGKPVARFVADWRPVPGASGEVQVQLAGNDGMGAAVDVPPWPRAEAPAAADAAVVLWQQAHWAGVRLSLQGAGLATALQAAQAAKQGPRLRNFHTAPADHLVLHLTVPLRVQLPPDSWVAEDAVAAGSADSAEAAFCSTHIVCPVRIPVPMDEPLCQ